MRRRKFFRRSSHRKGISARRGRTERRSIPERQQYWGLSANADANLRSFAQETHARAHTHTHRKGEATAQRQKQRSVDGRERHTANTKASAPNTDSVFVLNCYIIDRDRSIMDGRLLRGIAGPNTTKTCHTAEGRNRPAASPSLGLFGGLARCFIIDRGRSIIERRRSSRGDARG